MSGADVPELKTFDVAIADLMNSWQLPGVQLAVARAGRLVFDRGYGLADVESSEPVRQDHLFRIASVSKTITTVGILRLVDQGLLSLDDAVFPLLALEPPPGAVPDPRIDQITVRNLLVHAGGWNSGASGDPQYWPMCTGAAVAFGTMGPPTSETIVRFMIGSELDFDPGSASVYSNFGFNVAGRIIEHVSGQPYGEFIQQEILGPAGAAGMLLGKTRLSDRAAHEVRYYAPADYPATVPSVFPGEGYGSWAYGSFYMEAMDSHGGWIASASDLLRYATAIDGQRGDALLQPATIETMLTTPRPPAAGDPAAGHADDKFGLGWTVKSTPAGSDWAHFGALTGSTGSMLQRLGDGTWLAFVTNSLPVDYPSFFAEMQSKLITIARETTTWPDWDLFE